jgi:hypothetical protein
MVTEQDKFDVVLGMFNELLVVWSERNGGKLPEPQVGNCSTWWKFNVDGFEVSTTQSDSDQLWSIVFHGGTGPSLVAKASKEFYSGKITAEIAE